MIMLVVFGLHFIYYVTSVQFRRDLYKEETMDCMSSQMTLRFKHHGVDRLPNVDQATLRN